MPRCFDNGILVARPPLVKPPFDRQDVMNKVASMLEQLFGSKTRVRMLALFLHHPEDVFYVRELTRRINTQINAVRREIQNLERMGLIVAGDAKEEEAAIKRPGLKRKYYSANSSFPLLQEIRSLFTKAYIMTEWKLPEQIRKLGDVRYLAFMGMFSGQKQHPVDIFVVGYLEKDALAELMRKVEKELGTEIRYTHMPPTEYQYRREMGDRFVQSILDTPKTVIVNSMDDRR